MVKFSIITLLDGLLRSQCFQGKYCKKYHLKNKPGVTFVLNKDLRSWIGNPIILKALDAERVTSSHLYFKYNSTVDSLEFTVATLLVIYNFYPKFRTVFSTEEQLLLFRKLCKVPKERVIKYQKYITSELPNRYLEQVDHNKVPPEFEETLGNIYVYTGRVRKFLQNRLYRKTGKNLMFWNSWLQGIKRACHEAEDEVLYENYLDHKECLNTPPKGNLTDEVKTYMDRVTRGCIIKSIHFLEGSTSASFTNKRSDGGQRKETRDWLIKRYGLGIVDKFEHAGTYYQLEGPCIPDAETVARDIVSDIIAPDGIIRPLKVKVHGILEPLKVRKITKGESVPYWYSRSAQKDLLSFVQKFPQFVATGRPIERFDILSLVERENHINSIVPLEFDGWVSGDYSAATDGVDIRVTMGIVERIFHNSPWLTEDQKTVLRSVIGPQEVYYPKIKGKEDIEPFVQKTGQLMGSILSFPILCMINVITYWMSLEEYTGQTFDLKDLPCLVNGDDILFRANSKFYEIWKEKIKLVGFTMSIGKNYFHKDTFLINSQMFKIFGDVTKPTFKLERINFYNVGLLTGKAKTTGRDNIKLKPLWSWFKVIMEGSYDKYDAYKRLLYFHKPIIEKITQNGKRNLFIDRFLGGCGFELFPELRDKVHFTFYQKQLARFTKFKVLQAARAGTKPTGFILRLLQEEINDDIQVIMKNTNRPDKSLTTIDLGFKDKYMVVPSTQPLNYNESLELTEQHPLPLFARIPDNFDKRPLALRYPQHHKLKVFFRTMQANEDLLLKQNKVNNLLSLWKSVRFDSIDDLHDLGLRIISRNKHESLERLLSKEQEVIEQPEGQVNFLRTSDDFIDWDEFINDKPLSKLEMNQSVHMSDSTSRTMKLVETRRMFGGIKLIIHSEE